MGDPMRPLLALYPARPFISLIPEPPRRKSIRRFLAQKQSSSERGRCTNPQWPPCRVMTSWIAWIWSSAQNIEDAGGNKRIVCRRQNESRHSDPSHHMPSAHTFIVIRRVEEILHWEPYSYRRRRASFESIEAASYRTGRERENALRWSRFSMLLRKWRWYNQLPRVSSASTHAAGSMFGQTARHAFEWWKAAPAFAGQSSD